MAKSLVNLIEESLINVGIYHADHAGMVDFEDLVGVFSDALFNYGIEVDRAEWSGRIDRVARRRSKIPAGQPE